MINYKLLSAQKNALKKSISEHTNNLINKQENKCYFTGKSLDKNKIDFHHGPIPYNKICNLFKKNVLKDSDWKVENINDKWLLNKNQEKLFIDYNKRWFEKGSKIITLNEKKKVNLVVNKKSDIINEIKKKNSLNILNNKEKEKIYIKKNNLLIQLNNTHNERVKHNRDKYFTHLRKKKTLSELLKK